MTEHSITREHPTRTTWDAGHEPVVRVAPGDVVHFETDDFAGGQIGRDSTAEELLRLDFGAIYPLAGPVFEPGALFSAGDAHAAYVLCSLAGDLKITEVVDAPQWMVGCFVPEAVFTRA